MSNKILDKFFGKGKEKIRGKVWDWENFKTTKDFPIPDNMLEWVIGQDKALQECYLCLDEWVHKLKWVKKKKWWKFWEKPETEKPSVKEQLPAGPYLLLLGDAGTGKSLMGRALAAKLTELYKKHKLTLYDVIAWENKQIPSEPRISIHPAGEGKKIVRLEKIKEFKRQLRTKLMIKAAQIFLAGMGSIFLFIALFFLIMPWVTNAMTLSGQPIQMIYGGNFFTYMIYTLPQLAPLFMIGSSMLFSGIFVGFLGRLFGSGGQKGIGGSEATHAPKLIVDNSAKVAPFIDATGHRSSQLFGSIAWDPYQTGGLGTPEHQRVSAGDVHRAFMGILYIDEIKNLTGQEAVTLLTVLEDGQLPITLRTQWHNGGTSAMSVSTEPVPCMCFLVAAGNFDCINQIHPALMDRIYGYGKVVRMNNDMPNIIRNRRKYVQFIAQELYRYHLIPMEREACIEIINEARRRSGKRNALTTKFRPMISIIKTSAVLAMREGYKTVKRKHVIEAINVHCKTIQKQLLEHQMQEKGKLLEIDPHGAKLGEIYGLAVVTDRYSGEMTGTVLPVKAYLEKKSKRKEKIQGFYNVTGVAKNGKWIGDSIKKVRTVILKKYGVDIAQEYLTHIDFSQAYGIDGPSAGVTMTILLCSLLEGKPIRQDVAVTGEINIATSDEILVTAVGGLYEKIKAAEAWGFRKVIIPQKNLDHSIMKKDYKIEVIGARTLDDYLKEVLVQ